MKQHTIRLFMWGYQLHFQVSVKMHAEDLIHALNPDLEVETFLLGILRENNSNSHPVCLEPEDCGFQTTDFERIREDAEHRRAIDPDSNVICSNEGHHRSFHARVEARAYREAVHARLNSYRKQRPGTYFFSGFIPVGPYDVGVVLRLHDESGSVPYRLPKVHAESRYGPQYSLVEAAIDEFFFDCMRALNKPNPEYIADLSGRTTDEILRKAGNRLMEVPVWATKSIDGMYGLFNACNIISSLRYESAESIGRMLIARENHPNIEKTLVLSDPVPLTRHRAVRKLLQIATSGDALLCDGYRITGFGHSQGNYNQAEADLFEIEFTSHYTWELVHSGHRMMRVAYGTPKLPLSWLNEKKLASDFKRIFHDLKSAQCEDLGRLALEACKQRHGALLVISTAAEQEAKRLASQCTQIEPIALTPALLIRITAIDGAVLISPFGICYAIGVILDGFASSDGDPGRGSRYNSAVRYVVGKQECLAIIVSEDGTAEWIPNLRPQIQRSNLTWAEAEIQQLLNEEKLDEKRARKVLNWLRDHRFYVPQNLCEQGNTLQNRFDAMLNDQGSIIVLHQPLAADPQMSEEYILESPSE